MSQYKHKEKIGYEKFLDDFLKSEISYESIEKQNWRFDNKNILWDAGDKFHGAISALEFIINKFFKPLGIKLNGTVVGANDSTVTGYVYDVKDNVILM